MHGAAGLRSNACCNGLLHGDAKAARALTTGRGPEAGDPGLARACSLAESSQQPLHQARVTCGPRPGAAARGAGLRPRTDLPIAQGSPEPRQRALVGQLCGSVTPEVWPDVDRCEPHGQLRRKAEGRRLDLTDKLLELDPARASAAASSGRTPRPPTSRACSPPTESMFEYRAPPRKGSQVTQHSANHSRHPASTNQAEFERVF
ncbi:Cyclin-dependent kinase 9 [Plecturocebus cupreus]